MSDQLLANTIVGAAQGGSSWDPGIPWRYCEISDYSVASPNSSASNALTFRYGSAPGATLDLQDGSVVAGATRLFDAGEIAERKIYLSSPSGGVWNVRMRVDVEPLSADQTGAQLVVGTVAVNGGTINIANTPTVAISGTVPVSISGTPAVSISGTPAVSISGTASVNVGNTPNITVVGGQGGQTNISTQLPQAVIGSFTPTVDGNQHTSANFTVPAGTNQILVTFSDSLVPSPPAANNPWWIAGATTGTRFFAGEVRDFGSATGAQIGMDGFIVPFSAAQDTQCNLTYKFVNGTGTVYLTALLTPVPPSLVQVSTPDWNAPVFTYPVYPPPKAYKANVGAQVKSAALADLSSTAGGAIIITAGSNDINVLGGSLMIRPSATTSGTYGAQLVGASSGTVVGQWSVFVPASVINQIFGEFVELNIPPGGIILPTDNENLVWKTLTGDTALTATGTIFYTAG